MGTCLSFSDPSTSSFSDLERCASEKEGEEEEGEREKARADVGLCSEVRAVAPRVESVHLTETRRFIWSGARLGGGTIEGGSEWKRAGGREKTRGEERRRERKKSEREGRGSGKGPDPKDELSLKLVSGPAPMVGRGGG